MDIKVIWTTVDLVDLMLESRVSFSFLQVYKALYFFTTIPVNVAKAERSFSKLKLIVLKKTHCERAPSKILLS